MHERQDSRDNPREVFSSNVETPGIGPSIYGRPADINEAEAKEASEQLNLVKLTDQERDSVLTTLIGRKFIAPDANSDDTQMFSAGKFDYWFGLNFFGDGYSEITLRIRNLGDRSSYTLYDATDLPIQLVDQSGLPAKQDKEEGVVFFIDLVPGGLYAIRAQG